MTTELACFNSDVVIFDGSIEDEKYKQYAGAVELLKGLDYALIVSRTLLPFNFIGFREGGTPGYIRTRKTEYENHYSNAQILQWLWNVLEEESLELPRALKTELTETTIRAMDIESLSHLKVEMIKHSFKALSNIKKTRAFVSYLSRYSKDFHGKNPGEPHVEDAFSIISQKAGITVDEIDYFPPGVISLEFMTGQRRFEITSLTKQFIRECRSFWVYDTPDYPQSWWAYAELVFLAYLYRNNMEGCPNIYVIHPFKDCNGTWSYKIDEYLSGEEKRRYLPQLTTKEIDELETLYMNSNPQDVAYEHLEKMRWYANWSNFMLRLILRYETEHLVKMTSLTLANALENDEEKAEFLNEMKDVDKLIEHIRSYGYSKQFWEEHIVECHYCKEKSAKMTPEIFLHFKADYFKFIDTEQYEKIIKEITKNGRYILTLPCGHTVSVSFGEYYYRWWTVKNDVPTGPNGKLLEKINFLVLD